MSILDENDRLRPSYRTLMSALAEEFTTKELIEIAVTLTDYSISYSEPGLSRPAVDTLLTAVQEVIDRPGGDRSPSPMKCFPCETLSTHTNSQCAGRNCTCPCHD